MSGAEISVEVIGAAEILRAFRELPKEASDQLRDKSQELAIELAADIASAASSAGPQARLMRPTIKARRDRVPVVVAGGAKRVGRNRVQAGKLLYGSEFGSNLRQFKPHLAGGSYWFYSTVQRQDSQIYAEWLKTADSIIQAFEGAG